MMKAFALFGVLIVATLAGAQPPMPTPIPYYGDQFYQRVNAGENNEGLKQLMRTILREDHQATAGRMDQIGGCKGKGPGCYRHTVIGYEKARQFLMGFFYLVQQQGNQYGVYDVYCQTTRGWGEFKSRKPGPKLIPDDHVINVEHTWPQSRFTKQFPNDMQKSDLHHLFPTDSQLNAIRSSFPFGEVAQPKGPLKCPQSSFGLAGGGQGKQWVFQPPVAHRGNVARALFYFSVRYEMPIAPMEEAALRKWNKEDPPDAQEVNRNNEIFKVQGSRNPFVDYPALADRISDF